MANIVNVNSNAGNSVIGGTSQSLTVTILTTDWVDGKATKTVTGVTNTNNVLIGGKGISYNAFYQNVIRAISQGMDTIEFSCDFVPAIDVEVLVIILP